jgi:hypothetical protein
MRSRRALALALGIAAAVFEGAAGAQATKPIYLQYEGFIRQPDRTMVLSFGYFNTNDTDVAIPPGERNRFSPSPIDRQQPATFVKGRHRFACVVVVPADFDGNLRWQVENGGTVSTTTARVLDPNYALEDESAEQATAGLDLQAAARGVCLEPRPARPRR